MADPDTENLTIEQKKMQLQDALLQVQSLAAAIAAAEPLTVTLAPAPAVPNPFAVNLGPDVPPLQSARETPEGQAAAASGAAADAELSIVGQVTALVGQIAGLFQLPAA